MGRALRDPSPAHRIHHAERIVLPEARIPTANFRDSVSEFDGVEFSAISVFQLGQMMVGSLILKFSFLRRRR
ncbi:MAG: hypothetical protein PHS32_12810 [Rhodoferax sp.]|uniref:hypothetical protein n=1 Tax=Rhodoferax sp. TaxID=50421 RepID=UPI0026167E4A|nr:hypothetical protein [Rhodoferax sp.]MDD5334613.1 hypothetical protein [Rhodoferax sp.]